MHYISMHYCRMRAGTVGWHSTQAATLAARAAAERAPASQDSLRSVAEHCLSSQDEDISVRYRPYASIHGGRAFYAGSKGSGSASGDDSTHHLRKKSLKKSGSAVMLSDLEMEGSYHGSVLCHRVGRHMSSFDLIRVQATVGSGCQRLQLPLINATLLQVLCWFLAGRCDVSKCCKGCHTQGVKPIPTFCLLARATTCKGIKNSQSLAKHAAQQQHGSKR